MVNHPSTTLLLAACLAAVSAKEHTLEFPDVFDRSVPVKNCDDNAIVAAWCDARVLTDLECGVLQDFDEYGCTCYGKASLCPTECIGGTEPVVKTHYGIRCRNIPQDSPNYVLKERHILKGCENNGPVAAWCDDWVNKHLECGLYPEDDQYICKCGGKNTNCPDECIGGKEPLVRSEHSVLCAGIPPDSPNYILKEDREI